MDRTSARRVGKSDLFVTPLGFGGGTIGSPEVTNEASRATTGRRQAPWRVHREPRLPP